MRHEVTQEVLGQKITMVANMKYRAVRMHHKSMRNCEFTIEHHGRPYATPYACPKCNVFHIWKTYHYNLDVNGDVTVSDELYENMKAAGFSDALTAVKEVIPRPFAIGLPMIDHTAHTLDDSVGPRPKLPQPMNVISQEHGIVKVDGKPPH